MRIIIETFPIKYKDRLYSILYIDHVRLFKIRMLYMVERELRPFRLRF
jgi:hypothetical protein